MKFDVLLVISYYFFIPLTTCGPKGNGSGGLLKLSLSVPRPSICYVVAQQGAITTGRMRPFVPRTNKNEITTIVTQQPRFSCRHSGGSPFLLLRPARKMKQRGDRGKRTFCPARAQAHSPPLTRTRTPLPPPSRSRRVPLRPALCAVLKATSTSISVSRPPCLCPLSVSEVLHGTHLLSVVATDCCSTSDVVPNHQVWWGVL